MPIGRENRDRYPPEWAKYRMAEEKTVTEFNVRKDGEDNAL